MRVGNNFCTRCGHAHEAEQRFCVRCGLPVTVSAGGEVHRDAAGQRQPPQRATTRRRASMLPLATVLIVLVAGGGSAAAVLLIRHSSGQPSLRDSPAALSQPTSVPPASSSSPPAPSPAPATQVTMDGVTIDISAVNTDPDATGVANTLATYFGGIDARNYQQAWDTYSTSFQASNTYESFANGDSTSQDNQVVVQSIQHDSDGNIEADVSFQSHQAGQDGPNQGETCTNWSLDYTLVPDANATPPFLINGAADIGSGHASC